ncbi:MAG: N-acetylmuramoyl-L-alanine amidase [Blautia sp.]|nr:N-acetylmuramoyl-L-alanine amidase [Blautia sp.]
MKKQTNIMAIVLSLSGLILIALLFFIGVNTLQRISSLENRVNETEAFVSEKHDHIVAAAEALTTKVDQKQTAVDHAQQKAAAVQQGPTRERAPEAVDEQQTDTSSSFSVFSQNYDNTDTFSDSSENTSAYGGHVVGIDPGHQGYDVDMSAQEPNGPGSSEMKAKATTGTQGTYSGLPEYQLNLNVSLLLKDILELRGYRVVMTRTDNSTAISNKERAELAASQGAEIYVRVHANGEDSHTASGALTMSPSPQNPYIPQLYESSNRLSQCILDSYCAATGFANLGIQYTDTMTGINWSSVPVTIIEMGFMSNEYDDLKMSDSAFQQTMAQGIANGIDAYFGQ